MAEIAVQPDNKETQDPIIELGSLLQQDMLKVNELILANMQSDVSLIPQLAGYLIASGGKRIRPLLTLACTSYFEGDMRRAHNLAAAVEFIHTATLLHDDVVDESKARRGKDTANLVFGNQASVLVGDFLFSKSFQLMVCDGSLEVLRILSQASTIIAQGEVKQLTTTGNIDTEFNDYIEVISAKTAALFAAACEVGPVISDQNSVTQKALHDYGLNLGIAFQIVDDILDYSSTQKKLGKTPGDDFREGKMTAPLLVALQDASETEKEFWKRTIVDRNQSENDFQQAISILNRHNALERGLDIARDYASKAMDALPENNSYLRPVLQALALSSYKRSF
jgi:octaprenyl-diphosphate synthase